MSDSAREPSAAALRAAVVIGGMLIAGVPERELLASVAHMFPTLTLAEFSVALQTATAEAERKALRLHFLKGGPQ
jgi:hypothetical protein